PVLGAALNADFQSRQGRPRGMPANFAAVAAALRMSDKLVLPLFRAAVESLFTGPSSRHMDKLRPKSVAPKRALPLFTGATAPISLASLVENALVSEYQSASLGVTLPASIGRSLIEGLRVSFPQERHPPDEALCVGMTAALAWSVVSKIVTSLTIPTSRHF